MPSDLDYQVLFEASPDVVRLIDAADTKVVLPEIRGLRNRRNPAADLVEVNHRPMKAPA